MGLRFIRPVTTVHCAPANDHLGAPMPNNVPPNNADNTTQVAGVQRDGGAPGMRCTVIGVGKRKNLLPPTIHYQLPGGVAKN